MSVTKNSNQNQLQQVEMWLRHVHLHCTCNTTWSTAHASCIILWTFVDIAHSALVKTLAYTTGTTFKHQRATWPELYRKLILFLCIVVWHMRMLSAFLRVWDYHAGCCDVIKNAAKNAFLLRILKIWESLSGVMVRFCCLSAFSDCRYWTIIYFWFSNNNFRWLFTLDSVWV